MMSIKRTIAATQIVLIFPAALFMVSLLTRYLQQLSYEPAHTAQLIVVWYSGRMWTLWVFLIALPLAVLTIGCITIFQNWIADSKPRQSTSGSSSETGFHLPTPIIAASTLAAEIILVVVAVHMLMH
jgi:hypothetical protein